MACWLYYWRTDFGHGKKVEKFDGEWEPSTTKLLDSPTNRVIMVVLPISEAAFDEWNTTFRDK